MLLFLGTPVYKSVHAKIYRKFSSADLSIEMTRQYRYRLSCPVLWTISHNTNEILVQDYSVCWISGILWLPGEITLSCTPWMSYFHSVPCYNSYKLKINIIVNDTMLVIFCVVLHLHILWRFAKISVQLWSCLLSCNLENKTKKQNM